MARTRMAALVTTSALVLSAVVSLSAGAATGAVWQRQVPREVASVAVDPSGRIYVTGTMNGPRWDGDLMVRRLGPRGGIVWTRTWNLGSKWHSTGTDVAADPAGNIYVIGRASRVGYEGNDWFIRSYSPAGVLRWHREVPGWPEQQLSGMDAIAVNANMLVVAGNDFGCCGDMYNHGWVRAYDLSGGFLWATDLQIPGISIDANDAASAIAIGPSGESYVGGYTEIKVAPPETFVDQDAIVQKLGPDGVPLWTWIGSDPGVRDHDGVTGISARGDHLVATALMNQRYGRDAQPGNVWVAQLSFGGSLMWTRTAPGDPAGVSVAPSMASYVVGTSKDRGDRGQDVFLRKYSAGGALVWRRLLEQGRFTVGTHVATSGAAVFVSANELDERDGIPLSGWIWKLAA